MPKHIQDLLWETPRQREYRAAKEKFFNRLMLLILIICAIIFISL
jgi:hypothetical protein